MIGKLLGLVSLLGIVVAFYAVHGDAPFNFTDPTGASGSDHTGYLRAALTATALVLGIVFGAFHRLWKERTEDMSIQAVISGLRSAEMWRSLLLAPLVFSGSYVAAREQPDLVVSFVFAFQSGFFCDAVLQRQARTP